MNMNRVKGIFFSTLLLASTWVCAQTPMRPAEANRFKEQVEQQAQSISSLTANFDESKQISILKNAVHSSGILRLKGTKLLWKYDAPKKNAMLFDQDKLYLKDDKGKRSTIDLNKNRRFRPLQSLLLGTNSIKIFDSTNFDISFFKDEHEKTAVLTPKNKNMARFIKEVVLGFKANELTVSTIKIVEQSNDFTVFTLKNKKINPGISDSEFKL